MNAIMDIGLFRGLVTAVLFISFCAMVVWAWSKHRKADFDEASRLPLDENTKQETSYE